MKLPRLFAALACVFLLGGCQYSIVDYRKAVPSVPAGSSKASLAVSGMDIRKDVLSKEIPASYVGMLRDGWGIPHYVNTTGRQPLITELTAAIAKGYRYAGYAAQTVTNPNPINRATGLAALQKTGATRFLFFTINDLYSETSMRTEVSYDLTLQVLDRSGRVLAQTQAHTTEKNLGAGFGGTYFHAGGALRTELGSALTSMAESSAVRNALK